MVKKNQKNVFAGGLDNTYSIIEFKILKQY